MNFLLDGVNLYLFYLTYLKLSEDYQEGTFSSRSVKGNIVFIDIFRIFVCSKLLKLVMPYVLTLLSQFLHYIVEGRVNRRIGAFCICQSVEKKTFLAENMWLISQNICEYFKSYHTSS